MVRAKSQITAAGGAPGHVVMTAETLEATRVTDSIVQVQSTAVGRKSAPRVIDPTQSAGPFTHEVVASLLDRPTELCVIDLGAGPGNFTAYLERAGYRVVAIDIDEEDYRRAGHATAPFIVANLDEVLPQLMDDGIGGVVAIEILEHLESPLRLIRSVADVLVNDGWLIVTTPNVSSLSSKLELIVRGNEFGFRDDDFDLNGHISPISLKQLTRIGSRVGLEIERVTYNVGRIPVPRLRRRFLLRSDWARCELLGESLIVKFRKRRAPLSSFNRG